MISYFFTTFQHLMSLIQLCLFALASWISFTRISNHYHIPMDILCGGVTGVGFGFYFSERLSGEEDDVQRREEHQEQQFMQTIQRVDVQNLK